MKVVPIAKMLDALGNAKRGTLREAFSGEEPDFVQERDKLCTGLTMWKNGEGFSVTFTCPVQLEAGVGYVFEEQA